VTPYQLDLDSWYLGLLWMVTGEDYAGWYQGGQFGRIRPRHNFNPRDRKWGAWQLGVRYSVFDGGEFGPAGPPNAGRLAGSPPTSVPTNQAKAWTFGATWVLNPYGRFLLNYVHTRFKTPITVNATPADCEDAVVFRAQIDF
jgi:phosphate-selective porin OprO/OprP